MKVLIAASKATKVAAIASHFSIPPALSVGASGSSPRSATIAAAGIAAFLGGAATGATPPGAAAGTGAVASGTVAFGAGLGIDGIVTAAGDCNFTVAFGRPGDAGAAETAGAPDTGAAPARSGTV